MTHIPDLSIGFVDALSKLSWGTAEPGHAARATAREITVRAARNEVAAAQVRLVAGCDFVLALDRANWLHPLGFCPRLRLDVSFPGLPPGAVELFVVSYVEGDDHRGWMDALDRAGRAEVPALRPQAVYLRIHVPGDLLAGAYEGRVAAYAQQGFGDEEPAWEGAVHLLVADVTLPAVAERSFHLNLWVHCTSIARFYHVPLWSDAHFTLIDRYYASLAALGQKAVTVIAAEIPWSGQRCFRDRAYPSYLFEHAVVDVRRDATGALRFDYGKLDRLLALAEANGIDREVEIFGLLNIWVDEEYGFGKVAPDAPDAIRVRCYDERAGTITYLRTAAELRTFVRGLHDHLAALGVLDRVRIAADEPADPKAFGAGLAFVAEAGPGFKFKTYINHFEFIEQAPLEMVDAIPVLPLACRDPELTAELAGKLRARGGRMLWYVCCWPPIPNTFLHSPLVEGELHGWLTFYLGMDGFERWSFCLWPADPWHRGELARSTLACGRHVPGAAGGRRCPGRDAALRSAAHGRTRLRAAQAGRAHAPARRGPSRPG